jgi:hypothetical protein
LYYERSDVVTDNEKIARWAGWKDHEMFHGLQPPFTSPMPLSVPAYINDPVACFGLLDVLVEKGYEIYLEHCGSKWRCGRCGFLYHPYHPDAEWCVSVKDTKEAAIIAAVIEVIKREQEVKGE